MSKFSIALLISAITSIFFADPEADRKGAEVDKTSEAYISSLLESPDPIILDGDTSKVKETPNDRKGDATQQGYVTPLYLGNPKNLNSIF